MMSKIGVLVLCAVVYIALAVPALPAPAGYPPGPWGPSPPPGPPSWSAGFGGWGSGSSPWGLGGGVWGSGPNSWGAGPGPNSWAAGPGPNSWAAGPGPNSWAAGPGPNSWAAGPGSWMRPASAPQSPQAPPAGNPFIPPWIANAPWMPQWSSCTTVGSVCLDCNTKFVCTTMGGFERTCSNPDFPYCNAGACSATPTKECEP